MPLIRHNLALSYLQIGLLAAVPLVVGGVLELPIGATSGAGPRRRRLILWRSRLHRLGPPRARDVVRRVHRADDLLPGVGMFVSLTQSALMDSAADRRAQYMARWTLAGSVGAVTGPVLVSRAGAGNTWRLAFVLIAGLSPPPGAQRHGRAEWTRQIHSMGTGPTPAPPDADHTVNGNSAWSGWRAAGSIVRSRGAIRSLLLLEADLLLDVLTPFLALYLVAVGHVAPSVAALAVAVRLGSGLVGDVIVIRALARFEPGRVLRASNWAALVLLPAFLLVPDWQQARAAGGADDRDRALVSRAPGWSSTPAFRAEADWPCH